MRIGTTNFWTSTELSRQEGSVVLHRRIGTVWSSSTRRKSSSVRGVATKIRCAMASIASGAMSSATSDEAGRSTPRGDSQTANASTSATYC